ncbi:MAG: class II glutamine amidotransferase [Candidatus Cloacimonetes bacterium]|nr:class II glutamine amidotransferase [Candidatus Cloacimonadota bacterium]MCK9243585.1 class II glutamine amidotransferase [Candidatus Cloacimonadota bacterium]
MKTIVLFLTLFLTVSLLSADCKLMALIGTNSYGLSAPNGVNTWESFTEPCLDKLQSLGSNVPPTYSPNYNPDGWGLISYDQDHSINGDWRGTAAALNDPINWDAAVSDIQNLNSRIVLGHVRKSTNIQGIPDPHPFIRSYGGREYSFIHNGVVDSLVVRDLITTADPNWFNLYPPTHYPTQGYEVVDSEYYFLWILLNIHQNDGDIVQALKAALTPLYIDNNNATLNFVLSDGMDLYAYRNCSANSTTHPLAYFYDQQNTIRNHFHSGVMSIFPAANFGDTTITHKIDRNELVYISSTNNIVRLPDFANDSTNFTYYAHKLGFHQGVNWSGFPIMVGNGTGPISILNYFTPIERGGLTSVIHGGDEDEVSHFADEEWTNNINLNQKQLYKLTFTDDSPSIHTTTTIGPIQFAKLIDPSEQILSSVIANQPYWVSYTLLPSQNIKDAFGDSWSNVKSVRAEDWFYSIPLVNPKGGSLGSEPLYSWTTKGKNMDFGKGYIVTFKNNQDSFTWNRSYAPEPLTSGKEKAVCFTWEDKPDYVVIDLVDLENASSVAEIGVMQGDTCIGAVKTDEFPCQILAYPDFENPSPLTFEIVYNTKAQPSSHYAYEMLDLNNFAFNDGQIIAEKDGLYQVKLNGNGSGDSDRAVGIIRAISNYPNPFNPNTNISFTLTAKAEANILIYNIKGQIVREMGRKPYNAGINTIKWDGRDSANNPVSSGIYFIRINTESESHTHKMLMLK